jgi:myo-inositol 2-dehydrogenase/D-chiro-inositol 1-dehydrogenase
MDPVRIGIVGLGWWAREVHIPNLLLTAGAAVTALCSRTPSNLEAGREALGRDAEPFSSLAEMLAADAVDAVVVATPNHTHADLTLAALRAGRHVLVEKPLAFEPEQCQAIASEAGQRGLAVQVGVELRYGDVIRAMREAVQAGAIGQPAIVRTRVWRQWGAPGSWRADEALSGGLFHELAIHYFDVLGALADSEVESVRAVGGAKVTGRDADYVWSTLSYASGAIGAVGLCLFAAGGGSDLPVEVVGTEGRLVGDVETGKLALIPREGEPEDRSPKRSGAEIHGFPGSLESVRAFVECVRTGARPEADAAVGERLCRLCNAARESFRAGGSRIPVEK